MHFKLITKRDLPNQLPGEHAYSGRHSAAGLLTKVRPDDQNTFKLIFLWLALDKIF